MALGTRVGDRPVGGFGRVAVASFYATKMLSTGQGGALLTDDAEAATDARDRIRYDGRESYHEAPD